MPKLKIFGLSVLAVLAVSVASVPAASAAEGTYVVTGGGGYSGTQTGGGETLALFGGRLLSCATVTSAGSVSNGAKTLTGTPTWGGCHTKVGETTLSVTVSVTSCDYTISDMTTTAANTYGAKGAIVCPEGQSIHIAIYTKPSPHDISTLLCEYTADAQSSLTVEITDNAGNTIIVRWNEASVQLTRTFGTIANCGAVTSTAKLNGDTLLIPAAGSTIDIDD